MSVLRRRIAALVILIAWAGLFGPGAPGVRSAAGQASPQTKPSAKQPFQFDVTVALKLVQVYVTGRGGRPADDLAPEDFEVFDNGKRMSVSHFEKHFPEGAIAEPAAGPGRLSRKFFLFFDFAFMDAQGVLKARSAGLRFLDSVLKPGDEVGLMTFSAPAGLVLYEYLTADHKKVRRLVDGFSLAKATGRAEGLADFMLVAGDADEDFAPPEPPSPLDKTRPQAKRPPMKNDRSVVSGARQGYVDKAREFVETLTNLALALRYIPGYKNIILFSGGIQSDVIYGSTLSPPPLPGAVSSLEEMVRGAGDDTGAAAIGLLDEFTKMVGEFKASNSPIFACDVSGPMRGAEMSLVSGGRSTRDAGGGDPLRQMASETGGKFFANTVDEAVTASSIQDMTGAFYVLGYSVGETWDGRFHRIDVKVKRKGYDVIAQGGYFSPKPFRQYSSFEKLLHVTDLAMSDSPQLQVPAAIPVSAIAVNVKGKPRILAFVRASRTALGEVLGKAAEAYVLLSEESGAIAAIKRFQLNYPDPPRDTYFPAMLLTAKPGRYVCRVVLRNLDTGKGARGAAPVEIAADDAPPAALDPPLLLVADDRSLDLAASDEASPAALFGYDPASFAPVAGGIVGAGANRLFAALRFPHGTAGGNAGLAAVLRNETTGAESDVPVRILKDEANAEARLTLIEVEAGPLERGRYVLTLKTLGADGLPAHAANVPFEVR